MVLDIRESITDRKKIITSLNCSQINNNKFQRANTKLGM